MPQRNPIDYIVRLELQGFGLIILLTWLNELLDLPSLLFGGTHYSDYHEAALGNRHHPRRGRPGDIPYPQVTPAFALLGGIPAGLRLVPEGRPDGTWLPLEEYFQRRFNTLTTHGMCPECFAKTRHELGNK